MSPVLNHFKGSSLRMPGTSLDNANGGRLARPLASLRGGEQGGQGPGQPTKGVATLIPDIYILKVAFIYS